MKGWRANPPEDPADLLHQEYNLTLRETIGPGDSLSVITKALHEAAKAHGSTARRSAGGDSEEAKALRKALAREQNPERRHDLRRQLWQALRDAKRTRAREAVEHVLSAPCMGGWGKKHKPKWSEDPSTYTRLRGANGAWLPEEEAAEEVLAAELAAV